MELAVSKKTCAGAEAEYDLADVAQRELLNVNQKLREEGTRSYERERRLKVKGEQVQFVNGELRQRLQALADHCDEARRTHQLQIDQLQDALQRERDGHEMTRVELRMHEHELGRALTELGVHRAHTDAVGTPAPQRVFDATFRRSVGVGAAGAAAERQAAGGAVPQRAALPHRTASVGMQRTGSAGRGGSAAAGEWAAQLPAGADASATWGDPRGRQPGQRPIVSNGGGGAAGGADLMMV